MTQDNSYEVISEFNCAGKHMVTVRIGKSAHVMEYKDWQLIYGRNHQKKWQLKVNRNRFKPRKKYSAKKIS